MTDISSLLKEAQPLYFARKKRRQRLRSLGVACACLTAAYLSAVPFLPVSKTDEMTALYTALYEAKDINFNNLYGVVNWESDIPLDDYGLVAVI